MISAVLLASAISFGSFSARDVSEITIDSSFTALSSHGADLQTPHALILIKQFHREFTRQDGSRVPEADVQTLLDALEHPIMQPSLESVGLEASQRREIVDGIKARCGRDIGVGAALLGYYRFPAYWSDDYPDERVTVDFSESSRITLESRSQDWFGLPWAVTRANASIDVYDASLSRAVAEIAGTSDKNYTPLHSGQEPSFTRNTVPDIITGACRAS